MKHHGHIVSVTTVIWTSTAPTGFIAEVRGKERSATSRRSRMSDPCRNGMLTVSMRTLLAESRGTLDVYVK